MQIVLYIKNWTTLYNNNKQTYRHLRKDKKHGIGD